MVVLLSLVANVAHAQVELQENNSGKIKELLERVDALQNPKTKSDDCQNQKDSLNSEIKKLQGELAFVKEELARCREEMLKGQFIAKSNHKNAAYVVLNSFRSLSDAQDWLKTCTISNTSIYRNKKETWYHAVLNEPTNTDEIGSLVKKYRKSGFEDAWWEKVSLLQEIK